MGPGPARRSGGQDVAGVVLAAGAGTRLRPLTALRPKALCPVDGRPLLDLALDRLTPLTGSGPAHLAVNAHHHADQVVAHVADRATLSVERPEALGTAGALGLLRPWLDGRDVVVTNADAYLAGGGPGDRTGGRTDGGTGGLGALLDGWDGERCRLVCVPVPGRGDFPAPGADADGPGLRYVGACVLPWRAVRGLPDTPSGLYEVLWRDAAAAGALDLVRLDAVAGPGAVAIDCGTPADYLAANLHASDGASVVGPGAQVLGRIERCVVWDGAYVGPDEHLVDAVRAGDREHPVTVPAAPPA